MQKKKNKIKSRFMIRMYSHVMSECENENEYIPVPNQLMPIIK